MNQAFWEGRRVFVTGHTGFKGSWLTLMLRALGAKVTGYALPPPTNPSLFDLLTLEQECNHVVGDVRDQVAMTDALRRSEAEIVIHMAAQPLVRASYALPIETYDTNVMGTAKLLEACREVGGVKAIIVVTTDKCYENLGWVWGYRESDRLGGSDPYSNSKACCELVVEAYRHSYFRAGPDQESRTGLASARAGNVIGGGDFAQDRIVPDAASAFMRGEVLDIRYPDAIRPWQHVLEPLGGYLLLAERLYADHSYAEGWNFGPRPEDAVSVGELVDKFASLWGGGASWRHVGGEHLHEAATLRLDITKAGSRLGWRPRLDFDQTLSMTVDWFLAYNAQEDLARLTRAQVDTYLNALSQR